MSALAQRETVAVNRCDHCGCLERKLALDASPWTLVQCTDCGFVYTSPRLSDASLLKIYSAEYYENADTYAAQQIQLPSADHAALASRAYRVLSSNTRPLTSMDVGCGGGRLVEAFSNAGFVAAGVEPSEATVHAAQQAGRDVLTKDVSELADESFDCVTAMHVLEHVTSPTDFMDHLFRITKPGGLCIIEVPNFASKAAKEQGADWYALHPSTHLSHFTPNSLANCMTKAGFQMRSLHRLGGAGVFASVSEATVTKRKADVQNRGDAVNVTKHLLRSVWRMRSVVTAVPAVRHAVRWVNWELLGHGEFVRAFATKSSR